VSIVGEDAPLRVLAGGTAIEVGPVTVRIRLDEGAEMPEGKQTVVVIVHRTKVEMMLGTPIDGETDPQMVRIARVSRAE